VGEGKALDIFNLRGKKNLSRRRPYESKKTSGEKTGRLKT